MTDGAETLGRFIDAGKLGRAQPKYQLLKGCLVAELAAGRLKPGQALPSEDSLATRFRVARSTVRHALAEMERSGLVRRVQGSGTYVEDQVQTQLKQGLDLFALIVPVLEVGYYLTLQRGFESSCKESHCQMIVSCSEDNLAKQSDILMQLLDKQVGGIALLPAPCAPTPLYQVRQIRQRGIPLVLCHRGIEGFSAPLLEIPFQDVGRFAGETLARHGHRRVAYFPAQPGGAVPIYTAGLREALGAIGGSMPDEFIYGGSANHSLLVQQEAKVLAALKEMFKHPHPPTAIFVSFDPDAELLYLLLGQLGIRVPDDVSLISFGGATRESAILKRITAVTVDEAELGRRAAKWLYEMRVGERALDSNEKAVMPLVHYHGQTVGNAP